MEEHLPVFLVRPLARLVPRGRYRPEEKRKEKKRNSFICGRVSNRNSLKKTSKAKERSDRNMILTPICMGNLFKQLSLRDTLYTFNSAKKHVRISFLDGLSLYIGLTGRPSVPAAPGSPSFPLLP